MNLQQIKTNFKDISIFDLAVTHKSWVNENQGSKKHNERLEFLGDAILEYVVSSYLYNKFQSKEEGYLTALRSKLVNTETLAKIAKQLGLGSELKLSKGEEEGGGRDNSSLLANTTEALIGAIYIDQGLPSAADFIKEHLLREELSEQLKQPLKDPKSTLQEEIQAKSLPTPKYKVTKEKGPSHDRWFQVKVEVDGKPLAVGEGKSKAEAEKNAAVSALAKITRTG